MSKWKESYNNLPSWSFGDNPQMADNLAERVRKGEITATSSLIDRYKGAELALPIAGDKNIILTSTKKPSSLIQILTVNQVPFHQIDINHAKNEGYKSVADWKREHHEFFARAYAHFSDESIVVCETFRVLKNFIF